MLIPEVMPGEIAQSYLARLKAINGYPSQKISRTCRNQYCTRLAFPPRVARGSVAAIPRPHRQAVSRRLGP